MKKNIGWYTQVDIKGDVDFKGRGRGRGKEDPGRGKEGGKEEEGKGERGMEKTDVYRNEGKREFYRKKERIKKYLE